MEGEKEHCSVEVPSVLFFIPNHISLLSSHLTQSQASYIIADFTCILPTQNINHCLHQDNESPCHNVAEYFGIIMPPCNPHRHRSWLGICWAHCQCSELDEASTWICIVTWGMTLLFMAACPKLKKKKKGRKHK